MKFYSFLFILVSAFLLSDVAVAQVSSYWSCSDDVTQSGFHFVVGSGAYITVIPTTLDCSDHGRMCFEVPSSSTAVAKERDEGNGVVSYLWSGGTFTIDGNLKYGTYSKTPGTIYRCGIESQTVAGSDRNQLDCSCETGDITNPQCHGKHPVCK